MQIATYIVNIEIIKIFMTVDNYFRNCTCTYPPAARNILTRPSPVTNIGPATI